MVFKDKAKMILSERQRHLVAVICSFKVKHEYVQNKVDELINEVKVLSQITKTKSQAAYSCTVTAFRHKPSSIMWIILDISNELRQLDEVLTTEFLSSVTGGICCFQERTQD